MMNMNVQKKYIEKSIKDQEIAEAKARAKKGLAPKPKIKIEVSTKKKTADYCIIDHIGALESEDVMKKAYNLAYSLTEFPKMTYTMKKLIQVGVPYTVDTISKKQKNMIRFNKHPKQVIVIVSADKYYYEANQCCPTSYMAEGQYKGRDSTTKWIIDTWAEKVDCVKVILCEEGYKPQVIDYIAEECPWKATFETTDSIYRRCANIWGNALGWSFSAPLYRAYVGGVNEGFHKRSKCDFNENLRSSLEAKGVKEKNIRKALYLEQERCRIKVDKEERTFESFLIVDEEQTSKRTYIDDAKDPNQNHMSKISSKPSKFIKSVAVASEEECVAFFKYYKFLQMTNAIESSLEPGYQLCPHCGRPIAIDKAILNLEEVPTYMFKYTGISEDIDYDEDIFCNHCNLVIPAELLNIKEFKPYYDDTYDDDEDEYLDESFITKVYSDDTYEEDEF